MRRWALVRESAFSRLIPGYRVYAGCAWHECMFTAVETDDDALRPIRDPGVHAMLRDLRPNEWREWVESVITSVRSVEDLHKVDANTQPSPPLIPNRARVSIPARYLGDGNYGVRVGTVTRQGDTRGWVYVDVPGHGEIAVRDEDVTP